MLVVCVRLPDVPVIVSVVVLAAAPLLAVSGSTLVPEVGFVPHDAVTPEGSVDVTASVTLPEKPPASVIAIVVVPDELGVSEILADEAAIQNPGVCGPASASISAWPFALPQPVTRS